MGERGKKVKVRKEGLSEIRALLGRVRSKSFKRGDRELAYVYRVQLQRALINSRISAAKSSPDAFFKALDDITSLEAPRFARQPVGHDYLQQLISAKSLPIEEEIVWIASRVKHEAPSVVAFIGMAREAELAVAEGAYLKALYEVERCENELGVSLWSTELKIALTQSSKGTDAQKIVLKEIRAIRRVGMWPFVANLASVRSEPTVSSSWFLTETKRRQSRVKRNEFSDYSDYRALGEWPATNAGAARVLRTEQSHHIVDVYETFIAYLQQAVTHKPSAQLLEAISNCLSQICFIPDFRIRKLKFAISGEVASDIPSSSLALLDALMIGAPAANLKLIQAKAFRSINTAENAFALALSVRRTGLAGDVSSKIKSIIVRGLAEALHRKEHQAELDGRASELCKKFLQMYRPLPFARALRHIFNAVTHPRTRLAAREIQLAALNSDSWGFLDLVGFARHPGFSTLSNTLPTSNANDFAAVLSGFGHRDPQGSLRSDAVALAKSTSLLLDGRPDIAAGAISTAVNSKDRVIATQAAAVALNIYAQNGDIERASALISREHVGFGVDPETMPVREIYEDLEWEQIESAAHLPELSIALSLIQSTEGDDKLRTYRRFALETLLMHFSASKPSELRSISTDWEPPVLLYLLEKVCTPAMLDMLPAIRSTREVLEERREICGYLATLDKEKSEQHRLDVLEISRDLTVLEGLQTIDGSRVHVDRESLGRRLKGDIAESYQRYTSLVKEQETQADGFTSILKDIGLGVRAPEYLYEMPVSEPDELLVSIILRCREQFLFNIPHGLDSYISKRVRHGSIVGVVRAPSEREGVVAKRNLDGSYRAGGTWADGVRDPSQRASLATAISTTSKSIDDYLIRLKDTLLHVKSPEKPYGLLDAPLTPPGYLLIRSVVETDASLDSFIDTMFSALWGMLGASLLQVQSLLSKDSISFVSDQMQALRNKAQKILTSPDERAAFDAVVGSASVGMQSALVTAASWFEPVESASRSYSLAELVEIALASVRATTTEFAPELHLDGNSTYSFSALALPLLCDVLYIAFGNVALHGATGADSRISVQVDRDPNLPILLFKIESALGSMDHDEVEQLERKLSRIRDEIAAGEGSTRVRSEGGSGLYKLANMVNQSDGGNLEFGISDNHFLLRISLRYSPGDIC